MVIRSILFCIIVLGILSGCNNSQQKSDKSFKESYEKNFVPPCISSAISNGVSEDKAGAKCSCLARYLTGNNSPAELEKMTNHELPETKKMIDAAFVACK
jgi:hypothetical protein